MTTLVPAGPATQVAGVAALYNGMCKEDDGRDVGFSANFRGLLRHPESEVSLRS